jgi:cytosine/adenosine deaminase-related metal-dependent hydrolase
MADDSGLKMADDNKRMTVKNIRNGSPGSVIHRAGWVVIDPWTIYPNGFVRVENGRIQEIGQGTPAGGDKIRDYGSGVIFPALINAHTHLELCALKGCIPIHNGFGFWVKSLIEKRSQLDHKALVAASEFGIREMLATGCGAVGEISSLGLTLEPLQKSGLAGVWFREFLGDRISDTGTWDNQPGDLQASLAGHAPHTTSPDVLVEIKNRTRGQKAPLSIHLAESEEEMSFLTTAQGSWKDFLQSRGIDTASWGLPVKSPVRHLHAIGILDNRTILVHVLHANQADMNIIHESGAHVCLCPRSNVALHQRLPGLDRMIRAGIRLCLGTDSLASVSTLSMFDEMAFVSKSFPMAAPERIFQMATLGGAEALGLDNRMGTLAPGKQARLAYLDIQPSKSSLVVETLVNNREPDETSRTVLVHSNPKTALQ